jgi:ribose transport system permease protein
MLFRDYMTKKEFLLHYGREFGTLFGLIVLCIVLWILTPRFLTVPNLLNVAQQTSINAIIAVGMTFVIISAGIDLSVGSIVAFSGMVLASVLHAGLPVPIALLIGLAVAIVCGLANGLLVTLGGIPPFIATLGMMSVLRGAALLYTKGRPITGFSESFRFLSKDIFHIPFPIIIMAVVYIIAHFVLTRTKLGRYTYAIGGNEEAAVLSGVNVKFYKTMVFVVCGMMCGIAAIILTARLNSAQPIAGFMYELDAIAATVIGGTSLMGGEGKIRGTLIGALIMGVLRNGLIILGVSSYVQQTVIGSVIIIAVLFDVALKKHRK